VGLLGLVTVTDAAPLLRPQVVEVDEAFKTTPLDAVTVMLAIEAQLFASLTVTVYTPEARFEIDGLVDEVLQIYEYGLCPPLTDTCAEPLLRPQVVLVWLGVTVGPPVELTWTDAVAVQPPDAAVTVTV